MSRKRTFSRKGHRGDSAPLAFIEVPEDFLSTLREETGKPFPNLVYYMEAGGTDFGGVITEASPGMWELWIGFALVQENIPTREKAAEICWSKRILV